MVWSGLQRFIECFNVCSNIRKLCLMEQHVSIPKDSRSAKCLVEFKHILCYVILSHVMLY